jgi:hypothetical protein
VISVEFKDGSARYKSAIRIKATNGLETIIQFNQCESGIPCIINLSQRLIPFVPANASPGSRRGAAAAMKCGHLKQGNKPSISYSTVL